MNKAHYIIFHPDNNRDICLASALAFVKGSLSDWTGEIVVDKMYEGNEDPFVFSDPWLYSYCKAYNLRRNIRPDSYLQPGSVIFFCSGDKAKKGDLVVDTVFVIGNVVRWHRNPILNLPIEYSEISRKKDDPRWSRHFRFPIEEKSHTCVTHTYEALKYKPGEEFYSFLPLKNTGELIHIPFANIQKDLVRKIDEKLKGKYPILLEDDSATYLYQKISKAPIKIVHNVREINLHEVSESDDKCGVC